jgi:uncharacterized protein
MRIRDPIHGIIPVSDDEKSIIDDRFYQRLRNIRQLGFGELAFPGATHTRHAHSLGAMHVASRLFDAVASHSTLSAESRARFRAAVRLAVLCHDLGHMPFSHASEKMAPARAGLNLPSWLKSTQTQASHEDFTAKILLDSELTRTIEKRFAPLGVNVSQVVGLICGEMPSNDAKFVENGLDWTPLLRALVSGELDADRMDYLLRDSFYTGVNYGRYDLEWILQNLLLAEKDGRAYLALSRSAAFAFEDFLLSRYHMILAVYHHHTSVSFDAMLKRFYEESPGEFQIPTDPEAFLNCDDVALIYALRQSKNQWARRIVRRQGYTLLAQFTERDPEYDLARLSAALSDIGVEHFSVESRGVLSKYFEEGEGPSLFIADRSTGRLTEVARYTPLYERYRAPVRMSRLYVLPEHLGKADDVLTDLTTKEGRPHVRPEP